MERVFLVRLCLLDEEADVVTETEIMFLVLVFTNFAGDAQTFRTVAVTQRAKTLDSEKILVGDTIEEDDTSVDLERVSRF